MIRFYEGQRQNKREKNIIDQNTCKEKEKEKEKCLNDFYFRLKQKRRNIDCYL